MFTNGQGLEKLLFLSSFNVENLHIFASYCAVSIMYLLIFLSIISFTLMMERAIFFSHHLQRNQKCDTSFIEGLKQGRDQWVNGLEDFRGLEKEALRTVIHASELGIASTEECIIRQLNSFRLAGERYLHILGTMGSTAPFIGLLGTVMGIVNAFARLGAGDESGTHAVMQGISEALLATGLGLFVAIPALLAFNSFRQSLTKKILHLEGLCRAILMQMKAEKAGV
ncbi:MAG: MotA/TolQ/ExbB proton channel family protein [Nitrospinota bacterium]